MDVLMGQVPKAVPNSTIPLITVNVDCPFGLTRRSNSVLLTAAAAKGVSISSGFGQIGRAHV